MITKQLSFTCKDGREAVFRSPREEDIPDLLEYLYVTSCETHFLLRYPEECTKYTPEGEKAFIERVRKADNEAMVLCFLDGKLVGSSNVSWSNSIKTGHRANVAVALVRAVWGLGIGTRLMQELIRIAESNERILQLELGFIEGNARARALYEKLGFRITGVQPNAIRLKDGTLLNEYLMVKEIHRPRTGKEEES